MDKDINTFFEKIKIMIKTNGERKEILKKKYFKSPKNDYEDGYFNGILDEIDVSISDLEDLLKLKKQ